MGPLPGLEDDEEGAARGVEVVLRTATDLDTGARKKCCAALRPRCAVAPALFNHADAINSTLPAPPAPRQAACCTRTLMAAKCCRACATRAPRGAST